ncbi:MAG: GNAT family N-acetyltransferase [Planctomycetaceae bacterium]|nr:GNAT family N-acetyltransferase [Planctomycetaceae bacterium]
MKSPQPQADPAAPVVRLLKKVNVVAGGSEKLAESLQVVPRPIESALSAWLQLQNQAFGRTKSRGWQQADFRRELQMRPWYANSCSFFATDGPTLVGTITLELPLARRRAGQLHWLAVAREYQRRGLGRLLVAACERECEQRGVDRIEIETLRTWRAAMGFYASLGFHPTTDSSSAS